MKSYLFLAVAIVAEVVATSSLKASEGFSKLTPSLVVIAGYAIAFFFLSLSLRTLPVGIAYAIWSGAGTILVAAIGWVFLGQRLDTPAVLGLLLIVSGVATLNLFSKSVPH
jgi:small multidrug resistance pump